MSEIEDFEFRLRFEREQAADTTAQADTTQADTTQATPSRQLGDEPKDPRHPLIKAGFPTASNIYGEGLGKSALRLGTGTADAMDFGTRFFAQLRDDPETGMNMTMDDPDAFFWKPEAKKYEILQKELAKQNSDLLKQAKAENRSLTQGEMNRLNYTGSSTGSTALLRMFSDPSVVGGMLKQIGGKTLRGLAKGTVEAPRKITGAMSRGITAMPEDVLTKYATKEGKATMAKSYGREPAAAEALVRKVFKQKLPEEDLVKGFISQADDITIQPVINTLELAKKNIQFKETNKSAINAIDKLITDFKSKGKVVTAEQFREMRKQFDDVLGDVYEKEGLSQAQKAFKTTRRKMKELLIKSAPAQYKKTMTKYANKVDARSKIKMRLGKDQNKALERAETLLTTSQNRKGTFKRRELQKFDDLYGTNFGKRSQTMQEARTIADPHAPEGVFTAPVISKIPTGFGAWASLTPFIGWPKTAGTVLNAMEKATNATKFALKLPEKFSKIAIHKSQAAMVKALGDTISSMTDMEQRKLRFKLDKYNKATTKKKKATIEKDINKDLEGK